MSTNSLDMGHLLSRSEAAEILDVTTRTIDRYINSKKLSTQKSGHRVYVHYQEVIELAKKHNIPTKKLSQGLNRESNNVDSGDSHYQTQTEVKYSNNKSTSLEEVPEKIAFYEKIFKKLETEIQEKQSRIEIANYKIGQLETQLRNSMPLLQYYRDNFEKEKEKKQLQTNLEEKTSKISSLQENIKKQQINKKVYLLILLFLLSLQPLWIVFLNKG